MTPNPDFDWVAARSGCSLAKVFQQIRSQVENDINKRNAQRQAGNLWYEFSVISGDPPQLVFIAMLSGSGVDQKIVQFKQTPKGIAVYKNGSTKPNIEASLMLNNDGECRLKINDHEHEFWHLRRMALEELFFENIRSE